MALHKVQSLFSILWYIHVASCVVHPDGVSKVSRYQDDLGNYEFGYTVADGEGEHFHKAEKDALGRVVGSYGLTGGDGRHRIVDYVADQNGFRAHVRSNEPGVVSSSSADVTVEKTGPDNVAHILDYAASSETGSNFGERLKQTSSRVTYGNSGEDEQRSERRLQRPVNTHSGRATTAEEQRRQNRRLSAEEALAVTPEYRRERLSDFPRTRTVQHSAGTPVFGRYQPPIDPFSSGQLIPPPLNPPRQHRSRQEIAQPSTPPYGGIETRNPLQDPVAFARYPSVTQYPDRNEVTRLPVVSMSSIHGGIGDMSYLLNPASSRTPTLRQGNSDFPTSSSSSRNGFLERSYRPPGPPNPVRARLDPSRQPNLVLRAVAIPNGIQAVHVDPATGEIYNTADYPVYDPRDVSYDDDDNDDEFDERRPVASHGRSPGGPQNSDFDDARFTRNGRLPYRAPSLRGGSTTPSQYNFSSIPSGYNHRNYRAPSEPGSLSRPSAKDLHTISRIFNHVKDRHDVRHPVDPSSVRHPMNSYPPPNVPYIHDSRPDYPRAAVYPSNDDYDFTAIRDGLGARFGTRDLSSIFPLTFGREPFGSNYQRFPDPRYNLNRGYRHVGDAPEDNYTATPATADA